MGSSLAYDAHGNTTKLADQTIAYDVSDNHPMTTLDDGTVISHLRDVSGSVEQRTETRKPVRRSSPGTRPARC